MNFNFLRESDRITDSFFSSLNDSAWKPLKLSNGILTHNAPSIYENAGNMYKANMSLDFSPELVFDAVFPLKPHRLRWDSILNDLSLVKQIEPNVYVIRHMGRTVLKGLVSPRDSYDIVTVGQKDNYLYITSASVNVPGFTPTDPKFIRAIQYPSGFVMYRVPDDPNRCEFVALTDMDLNLNAISRYIAEIAKPTLIVQLLADLRQYMPRLKEC